MKQIFIDSSIEQDALLKNLKLYFPLHDEFQWGSFYGRTGIHRYDFEKIIDVLKKNIKDIAFENRYYFLQSNSMEKLVFMTLWCVRFKKSFKECSEVFGLKERDAKHAIEYILEYVLGNPDFEKHIHEAFAWSPSDDFPNKEPVKASDFLD